MNVRKPRLALVALGALLVSGLVTAAPAAAEKASMSPIRCTQTLQHPYIKSRAYGNIYHSGGVGQTVYLGWSHYYRDSRNTYGGVTSLSAPVVVAEGVVSASRGCNL